MQMFTEFLLWGILLNKFKWILSFKWHCQIAVYPNMPLNVTTGIIVNILVASFIHLHWKIPAFGILSVK